MIYLVLERVNQRAKRLPLEKLNDAMLGAMTLYHMFFFPHVFEVVIHPWVSTRPEAWLHLERKDLSWIVIAIMMLFQYVVFFHGSRWVRFVRRCQQDERPIRKRRAWTLLVCEGILFVCIAAHFISGIKW
ncbi:MAG: hypothetical protein R2811_03210 [Flavobacteriales bacterium]